MKPRFLIPALLFTLTVSLNANAQIKLTQDTLATPYFGFNFGTKAAEGAKFNKFRLDAAIGTQSRWLIFSPGTEIYFNLLPTYTSGDKKIHEFGIRFVL